MEVINRIVYQADYGYLNGHNMGWCKNVPMALCKKTRKSHWIRGKVFFWTMFLFRLRRHENFNPLYRHRLIAIYERFKIDRQKLRSTFHLLLSGNDRSCPFSSRACLGVYK